MSLLMQALKPAEPAPGTGDQSSKAEGGDNSTLSMIAVDGASANAASRGDMLELSIQPEAGRVQDVADALDKAAWGAAEPAQPSAPAAHESYELQGDGPSPQSARSAGSSGPRVEFAKDVPLRLEPDTASPAEERERQAAAAKKKGNGALLFLRNRRAMLIAGIGGVSLALAAALGYVYLQIQAEDVGPLSPASRPMPAPAVVPPSDAAAADPATTGNVSVTLPATPASASGAASAAASAAASSAAVSPGPSAGAPIVVARTSPERTGGASTNKAPRTRRPAAAAGTAKPAPAARDNIDILVGGRAVLDPSLGNAYRAYQAGDMAGARQSYLQTLKRDASNRDALLGLAAIAVREQQLGQARAYYQQLLELDPTDPDAIGGLSSLQQSDPGQHESHLKKVLARHPNAGAVLFALGNLYSQQRRWADAQQAYFRAFANAPANPDYAMNLAVSLDRLGQARLALDYYRRALALAANAPGNFAVAGVRERIKELEPAVAQQ